jgi:hypothetical protein
VRPDSFFIYVAWGVRLLGQLRVGETRGLTEDTLPNVVGPGSSKPSEVALDLTAQVFEISENTVEALRESEDSIPWMGPRGEICAVGGRPNFDLATFSEFQAVLRILAP